MKIQPFLSVVQGQNKSPARRTTKNVNTGLSFNLQEDASVSEKTQDVVAIISLENKRALAETPPQDLSAAEAILEQVKANIGQLNRSDLSGIHRLEGLVHFYMP